MQNVVTFLWFASQAEEAAEFYTSLFSGSRIIHVQRYGDAGPGPKGSAMTVDFELAGQRFTALNGGPEFSFSPAVSLYVDCENQEEVDELWAKLTEGGTEDPCGWLRDRYGLSWQIIPKRLPELLQDPDPVRADRAMRAMLGMKKIDVAALEAACEG